MSVWKLLVTIDPGGEVLRFARQHLLVTDQATGRVKQYKAALSSGTPPAITTDDTSFEFDVARVFLDVADLRSRGIRLPGAEAEVALWRQGDDWSRRVILLLGRVAPNGVIRFQDRTGIKIDDYGAQSDRAFPPWKLTREGFAELPENFRGQTMPVIYGSHSNVPIVQLNTHSVAGGSLQMMIAGHRMASGTVVLYPEGIDLLGVTTEMEVLRGRDHASGAGYSYITVLQHLVEGYSRFVCTAEGHVGAGGQIISGLGDVVDHAIRTYSGIEALRIDEERMSRFRSRANRLRVASIFGGDAGSTLIGTLRNRYEQAFQIKIGWRGGRLGADLLVPDRNAINVRTLKLGADLLDRIDPVEMANEAPPYSSFEVEYDPDVVALTADGNPTLRSVARRNNLNDERCSIAYSRWGTVPYPTKFIPDVNVEAGAEVALDWMIERFAIQRTRVSYLARLDDVIRLPIFENYGITDAEMSWTDEPFRLDSLEPGEDDTGVLTFTSVKEAP